MSDLQIGLAMLGVLIVGSVVGFNWLQERKFRRRGQETFSNRPEDVLLARTSAPMAPPAPARDEMDEARIEPSMEPRTEPGMEPQLDTVVPGNVAPAASWYGAAAAPTIATQMAPVAATGIAALKSQELPQSELDYIAEIRAGDFLALDKLVELPNKLPDRHHRISFAGLSHRTKSWEPMVAGDARYTSARVALQLVDRTGPVSDQQLRRFGEAVQSTASEMAAIAELPEYAPALQQALALDGFCTDVDVLVGINVIANGNQVFHGTKIRALAEAAGLQLQGNGVFLCRDDHGGVLFSLDNQESEQPFVADRIRNMTTPGITFLLDVPRVPDGLRVFDTMVAMSRSFAESLDGTLVDDNRALLNDPGLDRIRAQLRAIYGRMNLHGIEAGSALALRLFS
ncbi:MAG: cell division protein ZipA C-terminal FtsZ-binding domain-containing protein [Betaproteobacteria bacterium]